jgi:predicted  nucleic acid-binding Zn-ribbon protein
MSAEEQYKRISSKLNDLLKKYEFLRKENERLKAEILPAKEREMKFLEQIDGLEVKVMALKAGSGTMNEVEKKELDKKLHAWLKEIDRCISMLSE